MFRFRLLDVDGNDLGPFATSEPNWQPGHLIHSADGTLEVVSVVWAAEGDDVAGYLVVKPV